MPARTWAEISSDCGHDIRKCRFGFFAEHKNAFSIETSLEGISFRAIYELAEYGNPCTDISLMLNTLVAQSSDFIVVEVCDDGVYINSTKIENITKFEARAAYGEISTISMTI